MKKNIMSLMFFLFSNVAQQLNARREIYKDITNLKLKLMYVNAIKTFRFLFLSIVGIGASLVFLFMSLSVFNSTLFSFVPMSTETKMWVGFGLAAFYLLIAGAAFAYIFAEHKWISMFNAQGMINKVETPTQPTTETNASNAFTNRAYGNASNTERSF